MRKRGRHLAPRLREISRGWVIPMSLAMLLVWTTVALASDLDVTSVVDVTTPTGSVTLEPGESGNITINMTVSGNQAGTATFKVNRDWTLSGGTFTGSNPQTFTVAPQTGGTTTNLTATGTVSVAAGQGDGTFVLTVGAFDVENSNATGAKLQPRHTSNYQVTVSAPATPSDTTPPVIIPSVSGTLGDNGWYTSDVTVTWSVVDNESAISSTNGCGLTTIATDTGGTTLTCTATSAGGTSMQEVTIKRDATAPMISGSASPSPNANGWNNTNVDVAYSCGDNLSGVASCGPNQTLSGEGADQSATGTAVDNAGNSDTTMVSGINIDKTAPTITSWSNGPLDGASYYFGSVPAAPTCEADDSLSGLTLAGCVVSGYDTTVGSHTMTAAGSDLADNVGTDTRTYEVLSWSLSGFYSPVDMSQSSIVYNTVKGGSTVPLKFEIFAGPTELTTTSSIASFSATKIACVGGTSEDALEFTTTGATMLRYDSTAGQFIQNWQTPKAAGNCYRVTMTTQDGSHISAYFRIK